jgi:ABC-type bacteriocin/lantibiotic exporter with double-glycine peptidase domain
VQDILDVVATNNKQRFYLHQRDGSLMIRANQGHSLKVYFMFSIISGIIILLFFTFFIIIITFYIISELF